MLNITSPLNRLSNSGTITQATLRAIVFPIYNYLFALPIQAVFKIITCPPIESPIENCIGLVEWEGQAITIVDLQQKLVSSSFESTTTIDREHRFLILTETKNGELCGFLTAQSPTLIDIPLDDIHSVPSSYREVAELGFVSHIAILPNKETQKTFKVFLLALPKN